MDDVATVGGVAVGNTAFLANALDFLHLVVRRAEHEEVGFHVGFSWVDFPISYSEMLYEIDRLRARLGYGALSGRRVHPRTAGARGTSPLGGRPPSRATVLKVQLLYKGLSETNQEL
jgi:hypothetical protein